MTHAYATCAEHATITINDEALMRGIQFVLRIEVREADMNKAHIVGKVLQFTVVVHDTHRALVVSLRGKEFDNCTAMSFEAIGVRANHHPFLRASAARRRKFARSLYLDKTESARSDIGEPLEMAQGGNMDLVLSCDVEECLVVVPTQLFAVDR